MLTYTIHVSVEEAAAIPAQAFAARVNAKPWGGFGPRCLRIVKGQYALQPDGKVAILVAFEVNVGGHPSLYPEYLPNDEIDFAAVFGEPAEDQLELTDG